MVVSVWSVVHLNTAVSRESEKSRTAASLHARRYHQACRACRTARGRAAAAPSNPRVRRARAAPAPATAYAPSVRVWAVTPSVYCCRCREPCLVWPVAVRDIYFTVLV
jgi:hypothetical protein